MEISMLVENLKIEKNPKLKNEHGLSLLININGKNVLFDTGTTDIFINNAAEMGVNINDIDIVVISHGHIDHTGGLANFLETNKKAKIFIHPDSFDKHYVKLLFKTINVSVPNQILNRYMDRICFIDKFTEISKNLFIISDIVKQYPWVRFNRNMLSKKDQDFIEDDFKHELILAINNNDKLVIISGCSHNGIANMIQTVRNTFPSLPIQAVIGGFHLVGLPGLNLFGESQEKIKELGVELNRYNIEKFYTCHCTGLKPYKTLKTIMNDKIEYFYTGMQIFI